MFDGVSDTSFEQMARMEADRLQQTAACKQNHCYTHPGNQFDKVGVKGNTRFRVEDRRLRSADEIGRNDFVFGIAVTKRLDCEKRRSLIEICLPKDALHLALGRLLHGSLDGIVRSRFLSANSEIDDGDVGGGDAEGHACEFAIESRDDFANGLKRKA